MTVTIELTEEETQLVERYAKKCNLSVEAAFENALFERIEDECAIAFAREAYDEYIKSGKKTRPIDELWKELDL